jgi:hypothetical protein
VSALIILISACSLLVLAMPLALVVLLLGGLAAKAKWEKPE